MSQDSPSALSLKSQGYVVRSLAGVLHSCKGKRWGRPRLPPSEALVAYHRPPFLACHPCHSPMVVAGPYACPSILSAKVSAESTSCHVSRARGIRVSTTYTRSSVCCLGALLPRFPLVFPSSSTSFERVDCLCVSLP